MLALKPDFSDRNNRSRKPIKVMLVDDSVVARSIFERILSNSDQIEIACQAENPEIALSLLTEHNVDIILLDIEMPRRSGLDALPDLLASSNGARIMVVSSFAEENGSAAIQALSLGASDTLAKPGRSGFSGRFSQILLEKVVNLGKSRRRREPVSVLPITARHEQSAANTAELDGVPNCIAIGASTGGIPAIYGVIGNLDDSIDCPIFITQHLPQAFMTFFAKQLGAQTKRSVCVAEPGAVVQNNHIYIAPGEAHLVCRRQGNKVVLDHLKEYETTRYCPSVDIMFSSIASVYGNEALAIVLSGMGNDGTEGAEILSGIGAKIFVQNSQTSVVWGMPGSIARLELADAIMAPEEIGRFLSRSVARFR